MNAHHPSHQPQLAMQPFATLTPIGAALVQMRAADPHPATPLTKNERLAFAIQAHQAFRALESPATATLDAACRLLVCILTTHYLANLGIGSEHRHLTYDAVEAARASVSRGYRHSTLAALHNTEQHQISRAMTTLDLQVQSDRLTDATWQTAMTLVQQHIHM